MIVSGRSVYINQQWYETSRKHLLMWLNTILNRNRHFDDMLGLRENEDAQHVVNEIQKEDEADDAFERQLDQWGKESL